MVMYAHLKNINLTVKISFLFLEFLLESSQIPGNSHCYAFDEIKSGSVLAVVLIVGGRPGLCLARNCSHN